MTDAQWKLDVAPTVPEAYEAMTTIGRASLSRGQRLLLILYSVFVGVFAPMGATMIFWVVIQMSQGISFSDLPTATLPVTFLIFCALSFWLMRQTYLMIAEVSVRSRFGRAYTVTLDAQGITITTLNSRWRTGWEDVAVVRGSKQTVAIGISGIAIPLPRRCFLGPDDASDALGRMREWQEAAR